jgi:hypothetical protein
VPQYSVSPESTNTVLKRATRTEVHVDQTRRSVNRNFLLDTVLPEIVSEGHRYSSRTPSS